MRLNQNPKIYLKGFIDTQVNGRGLDKRTAEAYRLDLDLFFRWVEEDEKQYLEMPEDKRGDIFSEYEWEETMESYLQYLSEEKKLRFSTISRKYLVFGYYLAYLKAQGIIEEYRPLHQPEPSGEECGGVFLTNNEIDRFFEAINHEYEHLDSDFRKRICLRDQVMMELLFYHGIEISELLRMEVSDYHQESAVLSVRRKREKDRMVHLFSPSLQKKMEHWLREHRYFEHNAGYDNRMFISKLGRPLSMKMVTNIVDKYRVMAGIEKECTPKDLKNGLGRYGVEVVRERECDDSLC